MLRCERGYLIPAIGQEYLICAQRLKQSLLDWNPGADVTIITAEDLPHGDQGGQANDWQMFYVSPYRQTIKLESDMLCTSQFDHWWSLFENLDVVISQGCRDWKGQHSPVRRYRRFLDANHLPDVYNAITYWRLSDTARDFFDLTRVIWQNWKSISSNLKFADQEPSTDFVYAVAAETMGRQRVTLPVGIGPTITHMKPVIGGSLTGPWTREMMWEKVDGELRINTISQHGMFHYQIKDWDPS
jgi:hypothetical protein